MKIGGSVTLGQDNGVHHVFTNSPDSSLLSEQASAALRRSFIQPAMDCIGG